MKNKLHKWVTICQNLDGEYQECSVCHIRRRKKSATNGVIAFGSMQISEYFIDGAWKKDESKMLKYCKQNN